MLVKTKTSCKRVETVASGPDRNPYHAQENTRQGKCFLKMCVLLLTQLADNSGTVPAFPLSDASIFPSPGERAALRVGVPRMSTEATVDNRRPSHSEGL